MGDSLEEFAAVPQVHYVWSGYQISSLSTRWIQCFLQLNQDGTIIEALSGFKKKLFRVERDNTFCTDDFIGRNNLIMSVVVI